MKTFTNDQLAKMFRVAKPNGLRADGSKKEKLIPIQRVVDILDKADIDEANSLAAKKKDRLRDELKVGPPGSAERIAAMAAFVAAQKEGEEVSPFDITDEEIAENVANAFGG